MRERLYRSREDRMLFGVAGGMARYFNLDPSIVRIVWALLVLAGGAGLLLYVVAAIVIPEAPLGAPEGTVHGAAAPADAGSAASAGGATPAWGYRAGVERMRHRSRSHHGEAPTSSDTILLPKWLQ